MVKRIYKKPQTELLALYYPEICQIQGESEVDFGDGDTTPIVKEGDIDDWDDWDLGNETSLWDKN